METTRYTTGQFVTFTAAFEDSGVQVNSIPGAPLTRSRHFYTGRTCRIDEVREDQFAWAAECSFPYLVSFADGHTMRVARTEV